VSTTEHVCSKLQSLLFAGNNRQGESTLGGFFMQRFYAIDINKNINKNTPIPPL
jgi:hypothetical protein